MSDVKLSDMEHLMCTGFWGLGGAGRVERYVFAWTLSLCAYAAHSLYWHRRDWDERDRGDPADDGVCGLG